MTSSDFRKYRRLIAQLSIPADRAEPTQANLRWILANAWIENRNRPGLLELVSLIRPYV